MLSTTNLRASLREIRHQTRALAGHSHYHNIRHRKAAMDQKKHARNQALARQIRSAIRLGGADTFQNSRLSRAIEDARRSGMRKETIDKLLRSPTQATGPLATFEITMPGGVGMLVKARAENRNKITAELRAIVNRAGGGFAKAKWMFHEHVGVFVAGGDVDCVLNAAVEAGAEDVVEVEEGVEILCQDVDGMRKSILEQCLVDERDVEGFREMRAVNYVMDSTAREVVEKLEAVEEVEDVVHNACWDEEAEGD